MNGNQFESFFGKKIHDSKSSRVILCRKTDENRLYEHFKPLGRFTYLANRNFF